MQKYLMEVHNDLFYRLLAIYTDTKWEQLWQKFVQVGSTYGERN